MAAETESESLREAWLKIARTIGGEFLKILGTGAALLIAIAFYVGIVQDAIETHWALGLGVGILVFLVGTLGIQDLKSRDVVHFPVRKAVSIYILTIVLVSLAFGTLSQLLVIWNLANYSSENVLDIAAFLWLYLWTFLDLIPLIEVNQTLGWPAPVLAENFWAGLPVLGFRIFVIFELLRALVPWWRHRTENKPSES